MAFTKILMENPNTGTLKEAPVGFSWTTFFFGFFPALIRGDFKWALIIFALGIVTFGLSGLIFMFIYNKLYIKKLISDGYKLKSVADGNVSQVTTKLGFSLPSIESQ